MVLYCFDTPVYFDLKVRVFFSQCHYHPLQLHYLIPLIYLFIIEFFYGDCSLFRGSQCF